MSRERRAIERKRVECLGMSFKSEAARRAYFIEKLREKLEDPEFRGIEGFPIGSDEDILALSDPPFYTACPNPFIGDVVKQFSRARTSSPKVVDPFVSDITEGKAEHYYNVHTYHTKVPYRAIARFILHYTYPGDVVLDAFCGTGMTGLAAQACASEDFVRQMDPGIDADRVGRRLTILSDLSPAAAHIARNYNAHVGSSQFEHECRRILREYERECGWMFMTVDPASQAPSPVDYYVWSDVFACPNCSHEIVFWEHGVDAETGQKSADKQIVCPSCKAENSRDKYERVEDVYFDDLLGLTMKRQKEKMVLVVYRARGRQLEKAPDQGDRDVVDRIGREPIVDPVPIVKMMHRDGAWGDMHRAGYHLGITHFHHFYYRRSLRTVAWLWRRVERAPAELRARLRWWLQSVGIGHTRLNRYFASSYSQVNRYLKGFLYVAQIRSEVSPWYALHGKVSRMAAEPPGEAPVVVATSSATHIDVESGSVDYIFTDPPFGGNIIYSELNFLWEAWLGLYTNRLPEAIVSGAQEKSLDAYRALMERSFAEYHRVLKPSGWMTVLFHNSRNAVWVAIQSALEVAGFVVADVRVFDKKQLTMKQQTAATGTVQKDLVISAYKPDGGLERDFAVHAGSEQGVWDFVQLHLGHLPVFIDAHDEAEPVAERQPFLLFDRMVAFHLRRGVQLPMGAAQFYAGLRRRFSERDGMYFLPEQVAAYDQRRSQAKTVAQLVLVITDEPSAIRWLWQELSRKPQTYQEIMPKLLRELQTADHERLPELRELLQQNFLEDEAHRWYVPDANKQSDLERLREKTLLRAFEEYKGAGKKRMKTFRTEAVRAGFKAAWARGDYRTIVEVARQMPEDLLREEPTLLMYYDNASMRLGEE